MPIILFVSAFSSLCGMGGAPKASIKLGENNKEFANKILDLITFTLPKYIEEGKKAGVDVFIFSDSAGALDILGPKFLTNAVEDFYDPFLRKVSDIMDESCIFLLFPRENI